eukprot:SAG11_NODE_11648_length_746_cov_24.494590_1_plen_173_part_10
MDRADEAERELSKAQQEISDRTLLQEYTFEKPIPLSKIYSVFEAEHPVLAKQSEHWKNATTAIRMVIMGGRLNEHIHDKLYLDTVYASEFPSDLRDCLNMLCNDYETEFGMDHGVWEADFKLKCDGDFLVSIGVTFFEYFEPPLRAFVPKGCFRIIEKYLSHTLEEIANEPLE